MIYHIGRKSIAVHEGGMARDDAIHKHLYARVKFIDTSDAKIIILFKIFTLLFFSKKRKIIFHYPLLGVPVSDSSFATRTIRKIFLKLLRRASLKNSLFFDVSDLPIEQATDLELPIPYFYKEIERELFKLHAIFIFASYAMRDYVCKKFHFPIEMTKVCINGGLAPKFDVEILDDPKQYNVQRPIKFVYAGTLNRGRQIEEVIEIFRNVSNAEVYLMGVGGDWIKNTQMSRNIKYLGAKTEEEAHRLVAACDIGIVPYDSSRLYYQIAFPTKLSFYITAGLPFLSTDIKEAIRINQNYQLGLISEIQLWPSLIENLTHSDLAKLKARVHAHKSKFYWENLIETTFADI